jgi:hypothetical protein|tara:strand:- start:510 stop:683 length:174 start_codon:yes stop_codon:yes gene_type:complete
MKRIILLFFLFSGCAYNQAEVDNNLSDVDFPINLTFEEFKIRLKVYSNNSPYPNIDN